MKNKIRSIICIVALASLVAGCATNITTPFDESAFQPYAGKGASTITGQAFEKTNGGDVKFGAGTEVSLIPVTTYTTEMIQTWRRNSVFGPPQTNPQLQKYIRQVVADGNGNFEFQNVPTGNYYVVCPIFWKVPGEPLPTGAVASTQTHVDAGQTIKVVVTN